MRVCLISDGLPPKCGGAPLRAFRHAERFQSEQGIGTVLIAWDRYGSATTEDTLPANVHAVRLRFQNQTHTRSLQVLLGLPLRIGEIFIKLGRLLFALRHDFDLVHIINAAPLFCLMAIPLAKLLKKPVILESVLLGSDDPLTLNRRAENPDQQLFPHRPLKYALLLRADAYVAKSQAIRESFHRAGLPEKKVFKIPNGVDAQLYAPPTLDEKRELRGKIGLKGKHLTILFIGAISERKGVHQLLEAFDELVTKHPSVEVLVAGPSLPRDISYLTEIRQTIALRGLSNNVLVVPRMVRNVHEYMKASDIFCLPSAREGFPRVIIEAMATGLPVIATQIEGVTTDIIRSGREGMLVSEGDTTELANVMEDLIFDATLRKRLGQAARRRVLSDFREDIVDMHYMRVYQTVLSTSDILDTSSSEIPQNEQI